MRTLRFAPAILFLLAALLPLACGQQSAVPPPPSEPWVRLVEDDDRTLRLEVAMRTFKRADGTGPELLVAGAVHIADRPFYKALQESLDARDVVLFEGVKPSAAGPDDLKISDEERIERTEGRVRLLGIIVERHRMEHDVLPSSLANCAEAMGEDPRHLRWLEGASIDAWGNPIAYSLTIAETGEQTYDLTSLGADAKPGGAGRNADIRLSDDEPISPSELGLTPGIQEQLAKTFRLRFQLTEMDESKDNWRNADLSIEQINSLLRERGVDGDMLFSMLDGSSGLAAFASGMLAAMEAIPGAAPRGKLMIMELLSLADEDTIGASLPGGAGLAEVIIDERNKAVVDELRAVIEAEPNLTTVGIVYGAGHMPDLVRRLEQDLKYEPTGPAVWTTAMRLPLEKLGITKEERMMVRYSVLQQIAASKRAAKQD